MNKNKIGNIVAIVIAVGLAFSAFGKLTSAEKVVDLFTGNNMESKLMLVGIGELIAAALFAIPLTKKIGTLLLSAYFGGAIVFHLTYPGAYNVETHAILVPSLFLVLIWIISWLRGFKFFKQLKI